MNDHQVTLAPAISSTIKKSSDSKEYVSYSTIGVIGVCALGIAAWKVKNNRKESFGLDQTLMQ